MSPSCAAAGRAPQREPELHAVEAARQVAAGELLDLAHAVAQRVAVHEQLRGRRLPSRVVLQEGLRARPAARRRGRGRTCRAGEQSSRRTRAARRDRPSRAAAGRCRGRRSPRVRPALEAADLQGVARLRSDRADLDRGHAGEPAPTRSSAPSSLADRRRDRARSGAGLGGRSRCTPSSCAETRNPPPSRERSSVTASASAPGSIPSRSDASRDRWTHDDSAPFGRTRTGRGPRTASAAGSAAAGELVEEVSLQPALRVGDGARLRELDREQAERVAGHDPVELARLLGLAHGEERLDPSLRADRLHPDVVAPVDEGHAERRALGPPGAQLLPDPLGAQGRRAPGARDRQAVQVEQQRPALRDVGERAAMPSAPEPSITARVSTCSASTARCRVSYCSATMRVKIASVIAMKGTGYGTSNSGNPALLAAVINDRGVLSWVNPRPKPSPVSPASASRCTYARCFAGVEPMPEPRREDQLAALQPGRRVLELGHVHPSDRTIGVPSPGEQAQRHARDRDDVLHGHGHLAIVRNVQRSGERRGCGSRDRDGRSVQIGAAFMACEGA